MPTLIRFLSIIGVIGGICYGVLALLAFAIAPETREMTATIPQERIVLKPILQRSAEPTLLETQNQQRP